MADTLKQRPEYRNLHLTQLFTYRLPAPGWVSILHRISGAALFLFLPFLVWLFDTSVTSEVSYERFTGLFRDGAGAVPGWFFKLVAFGLIWAYVQHFFAGIRHLWLDVVHAQLAASRATAMATLALTAVVTLALGAKLFF